MTGKEADSGVANDPKQPPPPDAKTALAARPAGVEQNKKMVEAVLDQAGVSVALWGARHPGQLDPIGEIDGWHIDAATSSEIDAILNRCIADPVSPAFMAPPRRRPVERALSTARVEAGDHRPP